MGCTLRSELNLISEEQLDKLMIDKKEGQAWGQSRKRRRGTLLEYLWAYREVVTHFRGRMDEKMRTSVYLNKSTGLFLLASESNWRVIKSDKVYSSSEVTWEMDLSLKDKDKVRKQLGGHHIPDAVRKQWTHYGKWHLCFSFCLPGLCLYNRVFAAVKGPKEAGNVCLWFNLWMSSSFINAFIHHMPFILAQDCPWINSQAQQSSQTPDVSPKAGMGSTF